MSESSTQRAARLAADATFETGAELLSDEQLDGLYGEDLVDYGTTPLSDRIQLVRRDILQALIDEVRELRAKMATQEVCGYTQGRCWLNQGADRAKLCVAGAMANPPAPSLHTSYAYIFGGTIWRCPLNHDAEAPCARCVQVDDDTGFGTCVTLDPNGAIVDDPSAGIRTAAPKPKPTWKVTFTHVGSSALKRDLAEGWEPFAADGGDVYLRRQI